MAEHNDLGKWGEAEASRYLESKGYAILDRDWRFGKRDLDIVALSEDACTMVVVEVKTRASDDMRAPEETCSSSGVAFRHHLYCGFSL